MNDELLETMRRLKADPAAAIELYSLLFQGTFTAIVQAGSDSTLHAMNFLTYPAQDQITELPLFSRTEFILGSLKIPGSVMVELAGPKFWQRMLDVAKNGRCEVALDPGQPHGIRLRREMILGMLAGGGRIQ